MDVITFLDMLGIDPGTGTPDPTAVAAAAALWPDQIVNETAGAALDSANDSPAIVLFLQGVPGGRTVQFLNVRPGANRTVPVGSGTGQISIAADVVVTVDALSATQNTFYFRQLPDVGVTLFSTKVGAPARCFFAKDSRGWELIIEALPVIITLKPGLIEPLDPTVTTEGDDTTTFNPDELDNFIAVRNQNPQGTQFYTNVRIHIRPDGAVIFEPNIPVAQGSSRLMGLPITALYDLLLIPAPQLREYYEWARNDLSNFLAPNPAGGAVGFRSVSFDFTKPPFSDMVTSLKGGSVNTTNLELVCEDAVFPLSLGLPLPSHGTFGFRREIVDRTNLLNAFSLSASPVVIQLYPRPSSSTDPTTAAPGQTGSKWSISIDQLLLQSGEPPVIEFQAALIWQSATGTTVGGSVAIADDWTVQLGLVLGNTSPVSFTVVDNTVSVHAVKLGFGIGHLMKGIGWEQSWQILADLSIQGKPTGGVDSGFQLRTLTGKPMSLILRDIGWSFGHISIDGLTFPEGVQLIICQYFHLIILDMGWVEEPSGTSYFSFSGGIGIGFGMGVNVQPSGSPSYGTPSDADTQRKTTEDGLAIEVLRLRFRTTDSISEPFVKIDGIALSLKYGTLLVSGFGFITEAQQDGWQIQEFGFGIQVQLKVLGTNWNLAAEFFKGSRTLLTPPATSFSYLMAGLSIGYLPVGSIALYGSRFLFANNMTLAVDPPSSDGEGMVLYKWHKDHDSAIDLPRDRNLGDWKPLDNSFALGAGFGFSFNGAGDAFHINFFLLFSQAEEDIDLLIVGEWFLLKNPNPLGFIAVEYDPITEKFGVLLGINLKLADFISVKADVPSWMNTLVSITGNLYFGNQPWTLALGQLEDPRTWPSLSIKAGGFSLVLAVCFEYRESSTITPGSKGFGILFTLTYSKKCSIGQLSLFGSVGLEIGTWKTGSDMTGFEAWAQLGAKIYLFSILHIGLDLTVKYAYLGKHPWYKSYSLTIRIDTPWWMPDVSFSLDETTNEQLPYDVDLLARSLSATSAIGVGTAQATDLLTPPLSDGNSDPSLLYSFNAFTAVYGVPLGDVHLRTDIPIVTTDATIAINFTNPVSNDMAIAPETDGAAGDAGVQTVKDITVRYGLKSIGIRRSPRFGAGAGTWTDLVTPSDTALDLSGTVHLAPAVVFRWDVDSRSEGSLSPKRLLLNSSTPYTFTTGSVQNDEDALRNDPGFPCCNSGAVTKQYYPRAHVFSFTNDPVGARVPLRQQFSLNGVWWQWMTTPLPLAIATGTPSTTIATLSVAGNMILGGADFADPAWQVTCSLSWTTLAGIIYLEAYSGLAVVGTQQASATTAGSITLSITAPAGQPITRILLRSQVSAYTLAAYSLQIESLTYITEAEYVTYQGRIARCSSMSNGSTTGGKLSFLPNYDYEVTVGVEGKVSTTSQGQRSHDLGEVLYFRTKGLPGLNSVTHTGDEIEPYIESLYPPKQAALLYRAEPVVLAFTDGMSSILPVDRVSAPTDPPEKTQAMQLILNIDRVGSTSGLTRLTVPSVDWIDAHRATPVTRLFPRSIVNGVDVKVGVRKAASLDALTKRYVTMQSASTTCTVNPLQSSQVLIHEPIDATDAAGPWEPTVTLRATVRQQDGPYTQRVSFDLMDSGAFLSQADGSASPAGAWTINATQNLAAPIAGAGRQYACFGDLTWNHLTVRAQFDPQGAAAGIAVGVATGSPVPQAIVATVEPDGAGFSLVLRSRIAAAETELGRAAVTLALPVLLIVTAFDDTVRAQVGEVTVEADRGQVREGRVALVASGAAVFSALSVDALDLYSFDFDTSQYQSFQEHMQSWNGSLLELVEGAAGATSTPIATLLAADAANIAALMLVSADPQARQALFTKWTAALALPLRQKPNALCISRWTSAAGTQALLLESPEPISFTRDVTAALVQHVVLPAWQPIGPAAIQAELAQLKFTGNEVAEPTVLGKTASTFLAGDLIVHVTQPPAGPTFAIYAAPHRTLLLSTPGILQQTITPAKGADPALDPLRKAPAGTVGLLRGGVLIAAESALAGHTSTVDQPVTVTTCDNGPETAALLIPTTPLGSGNYTLTLTINRNRWRDTSSTNPESAYVQQQAINLNW